MRFRVLGTAAAEGWPALWCVCDVCREAARRGGKDLRLRSAYNIDDYIQIDFSSDALIQMWKYELDYARLRHLFFTHSHADHCDPAHVGFRRRGFAVLPEENHLYIYGNEHVRAAFELHRVVVPLLQAEFRPLQAFAPVEAGDVRVTPLLADHAGDEEAFFFLLESATGRILQGNDTGWFPDETWEFLSGREINVVLLDCTYGPKGGAGSHMGAAEVVEAMAELQAIGALAPGARRIATHLSHNGGALHNELAEYFAPHGIEVAYDGMELTL